MKSHHWLGLKAWELEKIIGRIGQAVACRFIGMP
jgi:hypothetical protein